MENLNSISPGEQPKSSVFKKTLIIAGILILVGVISVAAYFGYNYLKGGKEITTEKVENKPIVSETDIPAKVVDSVSTSSLVSPSYGPVLSAGILFMAKTVGMSVEKGSVTVDGKPQSTNVFLPGKAYIIYLSGVKGFTEFTQYGAPAKFVSIVGKFTVYDEDNNIIVNNDNIFSSYIGGIPAADAGYLQAKLTLPADFSAGNYRWEFIITDKKNSENSIKTTVNFKI